MRRVTYSMMLLGLLPALALVACSSESGGPDGNQQGSGEPEPEGKPSLSTRDAWNSTNNPVSFQVEFDYKYDQLATYKVGRAERTPWPSDYWSYYQDSINVRFHGPNTLSPAEKYDKAYNGWEPNMSLSPVDLSAECGPSGAIENKHDAYYKHLGPAAQWQHRNKGNWSARNGQDDDADGKIDECVAGSDGRFDYDGIETWWGLCHAWVPAAILEPEPLHPVKVNGVEFTVSDIKALLIAQYDDTAAFMLGGRCNEEELQRDETGRITRDECRDANAGAFFVVATNMLGRDKRAFAEDRTAAYQVWNQPVLGYRILTQSEVSEKEALTKLGKPSATRSYAVLFNSPKAVSWRYVEMDVDYISESANSVEGALTPSIGNWTRTDQYQMIIELDANGTVVGGEWIGYSRETHPDFLWLPTRARSGNPSINTATVRHILELSLQPENPGPSPVKRTFTSASGGAIPDNNRTGLTSVINVTEEGTIKSLKVRTNITHPYIGDLVVVLRHGESRRVLHAREGGSADNIRKVFDVSNFNGASIKGSWSLIIRDSQSQNIGTLNRWSITAEL